MKKGWQLTVDSWRRIQTRAEKKWRGVLERLFVFVIVYGLWTISSYAQTTASLKGDSTHFEMGDALQLKFVVNTANGNTVSFPKFEGDTLGRIEIISKGKLDTAKVADKIVLSQTLLVSAYDSGEFLIAPFKISFFNKDENREDSVFTNELLLQVKTLDVDTAKPFQPIKAPLKVAYEWREFKWWILAVVILLIAALVGFFLYKKYKKKPAPIVVRPRPKDPAHIWARKELKKLEDEKLWQKDEVKLYHSRLSDIFRSYLEYRYDYYALESTTEEIQSEIANLNVPIDTSAKLMEALRLADFVKFAKLNPAPDQNMKCMQSAVDFIEATKQLQDPILPPTDTQISNSKRKLKLRK